MGAIVPTVEELHAGLPEVWHLATDVEKVGGPIPPARNRGSQRKEQETADLASNADY